MLHPQTPKPRNPGTALAGLQLVLGYDGMVVAVEDDILRQCMRWLLSAAVSPRNATQEPAQVRAHAALRLAFAL